jgi:hypothetical protein
MRRRGVGAGRAAVQERPEQQHEERQPRQPDEIAPAPRRALFLQTGKRQLFQGGPLPPGLVDHALVGGALGGRAGIRPGGFGR